MNVYDFDNTILRGDSETLFFAYCLVRCPRMWLDLPGQVANGVLFLLKKREKQAFKERMQRFLTMIGDVDARVEAFWKGHRRRIKSWYAEKQRPDDVVISASPEFLILPICRELGIRRVMGSPVDRHTGRFTGPNCHGKEKVNRFRAAYPDGRIDEFFSDSYSDTPLARLARTAYLVRGDRLLPWGK